MMSELCNDYGDNPTCLKDADPDYTMRFDSIGEPPIYWCSRCGHLARGWETLINRAFGTREDFGQEFEKAINDVQKDTKRH